MVMVGEACRTDAEKGCQQVLKCSPIFAKRQHVRGECYGCERGRGLSISHFIRFRKISSYLKKSERKIPHRAPLCAIAWAQPKRGRFFFFSLPSLMPLCMCACVMYVCLGKRKSHTWRWGKAHFFLSIIGLRKSCTVEVYFSRNIYPVIWDKLYRCSVFVWVRIPKINFGKKIACGTFASKWWGFHFNRNRSCKWRSEASRQSPRPFFQSFSVFFLGPQGICVWTQTEPGLIHPAIHWSSSDFKSLKGFVPKHEISNAVVKQQHRQRPVIKLAPHC